MQDKILNSVTDDDIKGMPVGQRIMSYGILYDKERLETGKSSVNIAQLVAHVEDLQRIESE
jgi:hypothetical protein